MGSFTDTDYYSAAKTRFNDCQHLQTKDDCMIFAVYCAGVSVECIFRAYILKYTKEFDAKHDIEKLYIKSLIQQSLSDKDKEELTSLCEDCEPFMVK